MFVCALSKKHLSRFVRAGSLRQIDRLDTVRAIWTDPLSTDPKSAIPYGKTMKKWYTLYTKPNTEYHVAAALQNRNIEVYLPELVLTRAGSKSKGQPFFPCYLFARIDFDKVGLSHIRWMPGLRRLVTFNERPIPLPDPVMDQLQQKVSKLNDHHQQKASFKPGDTVRITSGPLCDMLAIFDGPTTPSRRVQVLLMILGHATRLTIDTSELEKAPVDTDPPAPSRDRRTRGQGRQVKRKS